jgi:hypothetical protein
MNYYSRPVVTLLVKRYEEYTMLTKYCYVITVKDLPSESYGQIVALKYLQRIKEVTNWKMHITPRSYVGKLPLMSYNLFTIRNHY